MITSVSDYTGGSVNLTFTEASIQFLCVSVEDDELVEQTEIIQLILTPLTSGMILSNLDSTRIEVFDNDCKEINLNMLITMLILTLKMQLQSSCFLRQFLMSLRTLEQLVSVSSWSVVY